MNPKLQSVLMHTLEVVVIAAIVLAVLRLFGDSPDVKEAALMILLSALAKYARVSPKVPLDDYVNKPDQEEK